MVTAATLRTAFPEFGSVVSFPGSAVDFWLTVAPRFVNANRWLENTDLGVMLFAAHNLVIEAKAFKDSEGGGIPGGSVGPVNSKSVDKVSVGYDTAGAAELDAGHWNLSVYGTRYVRMARMFGTGGLHIAGGYPADPLSSATAWPGPDLTPGFTSLG